MFVVFYSGERAKNKILKICEAFGANRYPFNEDLGKQAQMITEVCVFLLGLFDVITWEIAIPSYTYFLSFCHFFPTLGRVHMDFFLGGGRGTAMDVQVPFLFLLLQSITSCFLLIIFDMNFIFFCMECKSSWDLRLISMAEI